MSPRLLRPRAGGFHPDAADWRTRVIANGGTVSGLTMKAVDTFCGAIQAAGIRDRFFRMNLFCGSFQGAFVPLFRGPSLGGTQYGNATDTNLGSPAFLVGDYNETGASGGLLGDGSSKFLNTGLVASTMTLGNAHLSAYVRAGPSSGAFPAAVGAFQTVSGQTTRDLGLYNFQGSAATTSYFADDNSANGFVLSAVNNATGFLLGSAVSTSDRRFFRNGTQSGTTATGTVTATQLPANALFVFARNTALADVAGAFSGSRLGGYSIGVGMSGTDVAAFNTAMQAFQAALTRNV